MTFIQSVALLCGASSLALAQVDLGEGEPAKSDLRVLLVGQGPEAGEGGFSTATPERTAELYAERTPAFEALLRDHFEHVRVVEGDDYEIAMSDSVDVTLFDGLPPKLEEAEFGVDPETGARTYKNAVYLPESFTRPALMVGDTSPRIGEGLGLKLDWL